MKNSDYFICGHIFSRLTFALLPISSVMTIAVDWFIGFFAAILSIISYGGIPTINKATSKTLKPPLVAAHLTLSLIFF